MHAIKKLFLYVFYCGLPLLALGEVDCTDAEQNLCVYRVEKGDVSQVFARNLGLHDISLEIEFELENMSAGGGSIQRHVVHPNSDKLLAELRAIDPYQSSKYKYSFRYQNGNVDAEHNESVVYQLPYEHGQTFYVGQSCNTNGTHQGGSNQEAIDFVMPVGTPVHAARDGVVVNYYRLSNSGGVSSMHKDKGNFIEIKHKDGTVANYHHLRLMGVRVEKGQSVKRGELIGLSGNTGFSSGPHLHFAVTKLSSVGIVESVKIRLQAKRGLLTCPRAGLALKAVAVD